MTLFHQFLQPGLQLPAGKVAGDDHAVGRDQEIRRNEADAVHCCGRALLAAAGGQHVRPRQVVFGEKPLPACRIVVDRHRVDRKSASAECGIGFFQVGDFPAAGTAPRGPEVEQHPAAGSCERREGDGLSVGVFQREVHVGSADGRAFDGFDLAPYARQHGVVLQLGGELREPFAGLRRVRIGAAGVEECAQQVVAVGFQRVAGNLPVNPSQRVEFPPALGCVRFVFQCLQDVAERYLRGIHGVKRLEHYY